MLIKRLELLTSNLPAQHEYYRNALELPVEFHPDALIVRAGRTELIFKQAPLGWTGQYHFCFNIPENQFSESKKWISVKSALLKNANGEDEFPSESWNSHSLYFKDSAGNILEFIARHDQKVTANDQFNSTHILQISEIGLPSRNVISFANELCNKLGISVYKQKANETFTPIGDDDGLLILPVENRIWYPNTGVPAKLLSVKAELEIDGNNFSLSGVPYLITNSNISPY